MIDGGDDTDPLESALESDADALTASVRDVAETLSEAFADLDRFADSEMEERIRLLRRSLDTLGELLPMLERQHAVAVAAHRVRGAAGADADAARAELVAALEKLDALVDAEGRSRAS